MATHSLSDRNDYEPTCHFRLPGTRCPKLQAHHEAFYEVICLRHNGTTFPAEIRTKVATYGERVVQIASIYDISDRSRAEETALLDERNRMAREIHGIRARAFTGILLHVGAAMEIMVKKPAKAVL